MPALWATGISAAVGIGTSIFGKSSADSSARKQRKDLEKHNKKVAKLTNKHNDKLDEADVANYEAMREYSHEESLKNWQRSGEIQDYKYLQTLKQYEKSIDISRNQLNLNTTASDQAIQSEEASVDDMFLQQQFDREASLSALKGVYTEGNLNRKEQGVKMLGIQSKQRLGSAGFNNQIDMLMKQGSFDKTNAMVKGLIAEGQAAMGQAGQSKAKRQQSASAALNRGLMALETELTGKRKAAGIQLAELSAETSLAKTGVGLNLERIQNSIDAAEADAEYNNRVMTANMKSFISQTERNIKNIQLQKQAADLNVRESTMIKPERLSYDRVPTQEPERIFVERMEAIPGFTPQAASQSIWPSVIKGIGDLAGAAVGYDFTGGSGGITSSNGIANGTLMSGSTLGTSNSIG
jgi:hypothetical protein